MIVTRRLLLLAGAFVGASIVVGACGDKQTTMSAPPRPLASRSVLAKQQALDNAGCALSWLDGSTVMTATLPRSVVGSELASVDSLRSRAGSAQHLRVMSAIVADVENQDSIAIACIGNAKLRPDELGKRLRGRSTLLASIRSRATKQPSMELAFGSLRVAASRALMAPLLATATQRQASSDAKALIAPMLWRTASLATTSMRTVSNFQPALAQYRLQQVRRRRYDVTVTIWNSGSTFLIDDSQLMAWLEQFFGWDGQFGVIDYTDCEQKSAEWFALSDQVAEYVQDSLDYANARDEALEYSCESQGNSRTTCIDFFIAGKTIGIIGRGDGRTFDSTAKYDASRIQIYVDLNGGLPPKAYFNHSIVDIPMFDTNLPISFVPDTSDSGVWMYAPDSNTRVLQVKAFNGVCKLVPASLCPSIDAFIRWHRLQNGVWLLQPSSDIRRDPYPSLAIYQENSSHVFQTWYQSAETNATGLWTRGWVLEGWRQLLNAGLPPGCFYQ